MDATSLGSVLFKSRLAFTAIPDLGDPSYADTPDLVDLYTPDLVDPYTPDLVDLYTPDLVDLWYMQQLSRYSNGSGGPATLQSRSRLNHPLSCRSPIRCTGIGNLFTLYWHYKQVRLVMVLTPTTASTGTDSYTCVRRLCRHHCQCLS